jgi:flagellin
MQINTNIGAVYSARALQSANKEIADSVKRISSGEKLSSDDPYSITAGSRLKAQIGSLTKANESVSKAMGALQIQDAALNQISDILISMKEMAVAAQNAATTTSERTALNDAFVNLRDMIPDLAALAKVDSNDLLPTTAATLTYRVGAATSDTYAIETFSVQLADIGGDISASVISGANGTAAGTAEGKIDVAITDIAGMQGKVGGNMKALESIANINDSVITSATTSYSTITSTDLAKETANLAAQQIKQNAAAAMFAQSNAMNRDVASYLLKSV